MIPRRCLAGLLLGCLASSGPARAAPPEPDRPLGIPAAIEDEIRRTYAVLLDRDRAYLSSTAGVVIAGVKEPRTPRYLGGLALGDSVNEIALLAPGRLVAANGPSGIVLLEAADPTRPRRLASLALPGAAIGVTAVAGGIAVAAGTAGLLLVDLPSGDRPRLRLRSRVDTPGYARDVLARGQHLYLADGDSGVRVFRLDGGRPREVAHWRGKGHVFQLDLEGSLLAVAEGVEGLALLEVSTPERPRLLGRLPVRDTARGVALWRVGSSPGTLRAAVADGTAGLAICDLARPGSPREIGRYKPERSVNRVVVRGALGFVANDYDGLLVLELSASGIPSPIGALPAPRPRTVPKKAPASTDAGAGGAPSRGSRRRASASGR